MYKITVEEYYQDKKHNEQKKFHNLKYIKKVADVSVDALAEKIRSGGSTTSTTNIKISDLYSFVKEYDEDFNSKELLNPSLINEKDGTSKVFYHGTNSDFNKFDRSKIGKNAYKLSETYIIINLKYLKYNF